MSLVRDDTAVTGSVMRRHRGLKTQLQVEISEFLHTDSDGNDLLGWCDDHLQEAHDRDDHALRQMLGRVFLLFAEWDLGDRDRANVNEELSKLLGRPS